jgi:hypothetical protein
MQDLTKILKVGDEVDSFRGKQVVSGFGKDSIYPIKCKVYIDEEYTEEESYTKYGRQYEGDKYPSIWPIDKKPVIPEFPEPKFEPRPGQIIEVSDVEDFSLSYYLKFKEFSET